MSFSKMSPLAAISSGSRYKQAGPNAGSTPCNDTQTSTVSSAFGDPNYGPTCYFGYLGNEPRNDLRGARLREWDLSINKDTKLPFLGENGMLEFRAEMFNLLNHANWGFISNTEFLACAPFSAVPYVPAAAGNNGACGGSNESSVDF